MSELNPVFSKLLTVQQMMLSYAAMGAAYEQWKPAFTLSELRRIYNREDRNTRIIDFGEGEFATLTKEQRLSLGFRMWSGDHWIIPLYLRNYIRDGEALLSIDGSTAVVGSDAIDNDTRGGCIAYGWVSEPRQ